MTSNVLALPTDRTAFRRRALRDGLSIAGLLVAFVVFFVAYPGGQGMGFDAHAYWRRDFADLYAGTSVGEGFDVYRYSPAFAQLVSPLWVLPFDAFFAVWFAIQAAALAWLGRSWVFALLAFPLIPVEMGHGNIHLLLAVAIVAGFRYPAAWAFVLLTKVTPGIGLLWFAVRREWRSLGVALAATGLVALVSFALGPNLWVEWIASLGSTGQPTGANHIPIPLAIRLPLAAVVVIYAARTDRPWLVPIGAMVAVPLFWFHSLAMLAGSAALLIRPAAARSAEGPPPSGVFPSAVGTLDSSSNAFRS